MTHGQLLLPRKLLQAKNVDLDDVAFFQELTTFLFLTALLDSSYAQLLANETKMH
jgi:hypothetical protein